jgi:sugar lactone lactonase YvrE
MVNKHVNPKVAAVTLFVVLAAIQLVYWRFLVYHGENPPGGPQGGGGPPPPPPQIYGLADGTVDTLAGAAPGYEDGPSWKVRFRGPNALAFAPDGGLVIADSRNHRIRRLAPDGHVTTLAGSGETSGPGGKADGPAASAQFRYPSGVAAAKDGTVYIADTGNHRICRLKDGTVTGLAGGAEGKTDGQGPSARFRFPATLALAKDGSLWVADTGNRALRRVTAAGQVTTPAAAPEEIESTLGSLLREVKGTLVSAVPLEGSEPEPSQFELGRASAGASGPGGMVYFADAQHNVIMALRGSDPPLLIAGTRLPFDVYGTDDALANKATFATPAAVAAAPDGSIYIADYEGNRIRRLRLPDWFTTTGRRPERASRFNITRRGRGGSTSSPAR